MRERSGWREREVGGGGGGGDTDEGREAVNHSPFPAPWNGYPLDFYRGTLSVSVL